MGGQTLFATQLDLGKDPRRLSFLSNSTCGTFMTSSPNSEQDLASVYTHRSSVSSIRTGRSRTRSRSLVTSLPIFEESDEQIDDVDAADAVVAPAAPKMFTSTTVRVWKQTPLPNWMKVFVPRYVRLQTGSHPFMEYARQENGAIRQRIYLTTATRLERLPKNKLLINFPGTENNGSSHAVHDRETMYIAPVEKKKLKRRLEDHKGAPSSSAGFLTSDQWVLRFESKHERDFWAKKIQDAIDLYAWINKFTLGQVIMESANSTLTECFSWLDQGQPSYIVKSMSTESKKLNLSARNEIHIHHQLTNFSSHPNVLTLHDSFRQQERAYLVLEYCAGGDLFEHLRQEGALDEASAKVLFRRIAEAIAYIHEQNVVHLDIKPENLLFKSSPMHLDSIKLSDFGSAQLVNDPSGVVKSVVSCTVGYAAPEVLIRGDVSFAADVFSAGAVLFTMLGGYAPFQSPSDEEAMERTLSGVFSFDEPEWFSVSAQAKDLICGMLEADPRQRLSMDEVLDHPWLR